MEGPECPVCLEGYSETTRIARVLGCGHSACEECLTTLAAANHQRPPNTLRCPACTQLVNFPPSAPCSLPKNIDLLRYSTSSSSAPPPPLPQQQQEPFFPDDLYSTWITWVLAHDAVDNTLLRHPCFIKGNNHHKVRLLQVGSFNSTTDTLFRYSYVAKIMSVLNSMTPFESNHLLSLFRISLTLSTVSTLIGLWLDSQSGSLYLVSHVFNHSLLDLSDVIQGGPMILQTLALELSQLFISLQREGFFCGYLGLSCLCFDDFGHLCLDLPELLSKATEVQDCIVKRVHGKPDFDVVENVLQTGVFVSPELLLELLSTETPYSTCYASDVWLLASLLLSLLLGTHFTDDLSACFQSLLKTIPQGVSECDTIYLDWIHKLTDRLETLMCSASSPLLDILLNCLAFVPDSRPRVVHVWKNIRALNESHYISLVADFDSAPKQEDTAKCLALLQLCNASTSIKNESSVYTSDKLQDDGIALAGPCRAGDPRVGNVIKGLATGKLQCKDLDGHTDSITGFCVGGGFLFSSSFDKTVSIWSLEDFIHVRTFRGHEHRVMAVVFIALDKPLCVSADSGGGIFAWEVVQPFAQEPLKKWYEEKDWRYSGIHALAVSEAGYLYTGSGDRLIKVWSLRDYTFLCKMEGHKSVVSTLALTNGVLYSGSWDGTVRLWSLNDHSPLAVFGEEMPGIVSSVLCLSANQNLVVAAYEKGDIKIWMNDKVKASEHIHSGATFALAMEKSWLFSGGWDKIVNVQEMRGSGAEMDIQDIGSIPCDSVITALMYVQGILFVGYANRLIKVFS